MSKYAITLVKLRPWGMNAGTLIEVLPERKVESTTLFRVEAFSPDGARLFALAHPREIEFIDDAVADIMKASL